MWFFRAVALDLDELPPHQAWITPPTTKDSHESL
jgi:hypothetical protein